MILLGNKPLCPPRLKSNQTNTAKDHLRKTFESRGYVSKDDFNSKIWLHDEIRLVLHRFQYGKCCYCERRREPKREADVEHFRPKARVDGEDHSGYWWLAYEWSNLLFCCKLCNEQFKGSKFPLRIEGVRAMKELDDLKAELPLLPDLCTEDPEDFLEYEWHYEIHEARPIGGRDDPERGTEIVTLLGLDRPELNGERGQLLETLAAIAEAMLTALEIKDSSLEKRYARQIWRQTASDQPFCGLRRWYFFQMGLGRYFDGNPEYQLRSIGA